MAVTVVTGMGDTGHDHRCPQVGHRVSKTDNLEQKDVSWAARDLRRESRVFYNRCVHGGCDS